MSSSQPPTSAQTQAAGSKKRKRAEDLQSNGASVQLAVLNDEDAGQPVLACAGALSVPAESEFDLYTDASGNSQILFGETKKQEWESRNLVQPKTLEQGQRPDDARGYYSQCVVTLI